MCIQLLNTHNSNSKPVTYNPNPTVTQNLLFGYKTHSYVSTFKFTFLPKWWSPHHWLYIVGLLLLPASFSSPLPYSPIRQPRKAKQSLTPIFFNLLHNGFIVATTFSFASIFFHFLFNFPNPLQISYCFSLIHNPYFISTHSKSLFFFFLLPIAQAPLLNNLLKECAYIQNYQNNPHHFSNLHFHGHLLLQPSHTHTVSLPLLLSQFQKTNSYFPSNPSTLLHQNATVSISISQCQRTTKTESERLLKTVLVWFCLVVVIKKLKLYKI